jgi:predicted nucleic acid-binding protein
LTSRPSNNLIIAGHQQITNEWWKKVRQKFDCFISEIVISEISRGDKKASSERLKAIKDINLLAYNAEIQELGSKYLNLLKIPEKSNLDALHLAVAVWYGIDFLASWNCKHIANAMINLKLRDYNFSNGLNSPILCTPEELMEVNDE